MPLLKYTRVIRSTGSYRFFNVSFINGRAELNDNSDEDCLTTAGNFKDGGDILNDVFVEESIEYIQKGIYD